MCKDVWVEAYEQLWHRLKREPTEDEITDYIAARREELYERVAEEKRYEMSKMQPQRELQA